MIDYVVPVISLVFMAVGVIAMVFLVTDEDE